MRKNTRHIGAEERIRKEKEHDRHHRQAHDPPRRLNDKQNAEAAHDDIGHRHRSRARDELTVLDDNVGRRRRAENGEGDIDGMEKMVACPRAPERVEQVGKRKPESEMNGALQLCIKHAECRRIDLKDGECNGDRGDDFLRPARIVNRVRFTVIFLQNCIRINSILIGHTANHILCEKEYEAACRQPRQKSTSTSSKNMCTAAQRRDRCACRRDTSHRRGSPVRPPRS